MSQTAESINQPIPKSYWQDEQWAFDHYPSWSSATGIAGLR